ncbi:DMT family transporter [Paracoccus sp. (in: a-proteobacteria)]|uniref:DMT family transporter n=1 Tax=Paracoccus sp. TaxID=267 RepID=UPI0028A09CC9|nr:DMT family transporter [Paracoccus sp. (in: a-proteobacteria)]
MTNRFLPASREALQGHAAMLLFSLLVAGSFSFGVRSANLIDPGAITAARFAIAAGVIGGFAAARPGGIPRFAWRAPWRYPVLGAIFAAYFVLMFEGLKTADAVSAAAVFTLTPVMSAGFAWLLLRQKMSFQIATALLLGGCGALWVIFRGDLHQLMRLQLGRGEAIYLLGCAFHALYTPLVRKLNRGESAVVFSFGALLGGLIVLVIWEWRAIGATDWLHLPVIVWATVLYTAIFATGVSFVLVQFATLRLPSAKVMAYTYLTPAWVIGLEAILGQGLPGIVVVPGLLATVTALGLLLRD